MLNKIPLFHQSLGPRVLLSFSLFLSLRLFLWSAEVLWVHFPAQASTRNLLWLSCSGPNHEMQSTQGVDEWVSRSICSQKMFYRKKKKKKDPLEKAFWAFTPSRGRLRPSWTEQAHAWALLAFCVKQGISASLSLLYFLIAQLWTTRFWSIKRPQQWSRSES